MIAPATTALTHSLVHAYWMLATGSAGTWMASEESDVVPELQVPRYPDTPIETTQITPCVDKVKVVLCRHHFHSIHFAKHNPTSAAYTSSLLPCYHCSLSSLSCESTKPPPKTCETLVIRRCLRSDLLPGLPRGLPLAAITVSPRTLDLESATIFDRCSACHLISASCTGIAI